MAEFFERFNLGGAGEWLRTAVILAGIGSLAVLDTRFVSRADYVIDRKATEENSKFQADALQAVRTSLALQEQQLATLKDHEKRIRAIEFGGGKRRELSTND